MINLVLTLVTNFVMVIYLPMIMFLLALMKNNLKEMFNNVLNWAYTNEMSFGINECASKVLK